MRKTAFVLLGLSLLPLACKSKRAMLDNAPSGAAEPVMAAPPQGPAASGEAYHDWGKNPWVDAAKDHLSTFAADVDTASYTIARRKLTEGTLPPPASVRVEEFVNYFRYAFPEPAADSPFAVIMDAAPSPLSPGRHILRVGVGTKARSRGERKPAHLVFLVDVSGSMDSPDTGLYPRRTAAKRGLLGSITPPTRPGGLAIGTTA